MKTSSNILALVLASLAVASNRAALAAVLTDMSLTLDIDASAACLAGKTLAVFAGTQE